MCTGAEPAAVCAATAASAAGSAGAAGTGLSLGAGGLGLSAGAGGLGLTAASSGAGLIGAGLGTELAALGTGSLLGASALGGLGGGEALAGLGELGSLGGTGIDYGLGSTIGDSVGTALGTGGGELGAGIGSSIPTDTGLGSLYGGEGATTGLGNTGTLGNTNYSLLDSPVSSQGLQPGGGGLGLQAPAAETGGGGLGDIFKGVYNSADSFLSPVGGVKGARTAASLYDLYAKYEQGQAQKQAMRDFTNSVNTTYAPGGALAQQLSQQLARKDAAAGRNSQYGTRSVELAARLEQMRQQALTSTYGQTLGGVRNANQDIYGGLSSLFYNLGKDK